YGFQTAPAASQLLADLVTGHQSALDQATIAALSASRFR
ncbi:MAG TPA: glycerol-3-phosphate dehydrogenase, partial [Roseibacterium sp.]|nr:glycerol-3-phosphate dehydrogenase [Roseibacterium sp.]